MAKLIVDTENLRENYWALRRLVGDKTLIAVLKCNGYGMGLLPAGRILECLGADMLALSSVEDALRLRWAGIRIPILLLSPLWREEEAEKCIRAGITLSVGDAVSAGAAVRAGERLGQMPHVHLSVDTGLGRYGFDPERGEDADRLCQGLRVVGTFSHLAAGWDKRKTEGQYARFLRFCTGLEKAGTKSGLRHLCASAAAIGYPQFHLDGVRLGSALVGRVLGGEKLGLRPVCRLRGEVQAVSFRRKGDRLGYGKGVLLKKDSMVAVTDLGYSSGFGLERGGQRERLGGVLRRLFRPGMTAEIGGHRCPVLGAPQCTSGFVDVSGLECRPGTEVLAEVNPMLVPRDTEREYLGPFTKFSSSVQKRYIDS